jgi:BTB/POZ domain
MIEEEMIENRNSQRQDPEPEQRLQELISTLNRLSNELLTLVNSRPANSQHVEEPLMLYDLPETTAGSWATAQDNGWGHLSLPPTALSPPASPRLPSRAASPAPSAGPAVALTIEPPSAITTEPSFESQRYGTGVPVRVNLLGRVFAVSWALLARLPADSRLGRLVQCRSLPEVLTVCDRYEGTRNEFFFNHRPQAGGWMDIWWTLVYTSIPHGYFLHVKSFNYVCQCISWYFRSRKITI